jgi:hypothetical protein
MSAVAVSYKIGFLFAGLAILFTILVWFTVPETKGLTYGTYSGHFWALNACGRLLTDLSGQIDDLFERRVPAWRFKTEVRNVHDQANMQPSAA